MGEGVLIYRQPKAAPYLPRSGWLLRVIENGIIHRNERQTTPSHGNDIYMDVITSRHLINVKSACLLP